MEGPVSTIQENLHGATPAVTPVRRGYVRTAVAVEIRDEDCGHLAYILKYGVGVPSAAEVVQHNEASQVIREDYIGLAIAIYVRNRLVACSSLPREQARCAQGLALRRAGPFPSRGTDSEPSCW